MNRKARTRDTIIALINLAVIGIVSLVFYHYWYRFYHDLVYFYQRGNWLILCVYFLCLLMFNSTFGGFKLGYSRTNDLIFSQVLSVLFGDVVVYILASFVKKGFIPMGGFWYLLAVQILVTIVLNVIVNFLYYRMFPAREAILLYEGECSKVYDKLLRYHDRAFHIERKCEYSDSMLKELEGKYECVIIDHLPAQNKQAVLRHCYEKSIGVLEVPDLFDIIQNNASNTHLIDTPLLRLNKFGPDQVSKIAKRAFDIVFALIFLVITSPFALITALAVKLYDGGPVLYKQTRLTQYGREFKILKFRSMRVDAEKVGGAQFAKENDSRITPVGKFIRACRLDELPQLLNILRGDMSVVGPRPERPEIVEKIKKDIPEFDFRLKVKAGLTGYAQVYGKYNTELKDKLLLDLMYIENFSVLLDLKLCLMTFKILFIKDSTEGVSE